MAAAGARILEPGAQRGERGRALLVVGRVHVDVQRLGARRGDLRLDLLDVREGRPEVEVDAADPVARRRERQRRGLAHPGRRAEDQGPSLAVVGHRCSSGCSRPGAVRYPGGAESIVSPFAARPPARPRFGPHRHGATGRETRCWGRDDPRVREPHAAGAAAARPLAIVQVGLLVFAIVDLLRDDRRRARREQGHLGRHHRVRQHDRADPLLPRRSRGGPGRAAGPGPGAMPGWGSPHDPPIVAAAGRSVGAPRRARRRRRPVAGGLSSRRVRRRVRGPTPTRRRS